MKRLSLFIAFFCFFHAIIVAQAFRKDYVIQKGIDTECSDIKAGYDGGYFVAGTSGNAGFIAKFDHSSALVWQKDINLPANQSYLSISRISILPLSDGSLIVLIGRFDCDVFDSDYLMRLSSDGSTLIWDKVTDGFFQGLLPGENETFFLLNWNDNKVLGWDGVTIPNNGTLLIPDVKISLPDHRSVNGDKEKVWLAGPDGNITGLPWYSPEAVIRLDTGEQGEVFVFGANTIYALNPGLQLISQKNFPGVGALNIHTCPGGFLSFNQNQNVSKLVRWNTDGVMVGELNLGKLKDPGYFIVKEDRFFIGGTISPDNQGYSAWVASDNITTTGTWQTGTDLSVTNLLFSGTPTGSQWYNFPYSYSSANYTNVSAVVKNNGMDTVKSFQLNFRVNGCDFFCGSTGGRVGNITDIQLAPGASQTVFFDSLTIMCTTSDVRNCCVWASGINHHRDDIVADNIFCAYLPNITVATKELNEADIFLVPNPADDMLYLQLPQNIIAEDYSIFDLNGRLVQSGIFNNNALHLSNIAAGMYFLRLSGANGLWGIKRFVKM